MKRKRHTLRTIEDEQDHRTRLHITTLGQARYDLEGLSERSTYPITHKQKHHISSAVLTATPVLPLFRHRHA